MSGDQYMEPVPQQRKLEMLAQLMMILVLDAGGKLEFENVNKYASAGTFRLELEIDKAHKRITVLCRRVPDPWN